VRCGWRSALLVALLALQAGASRADGDGLALYGPARALVEVGERSLAAGDTSGALSAFEQAAGTQHAAQIEASVVRAYMQAGQYRQALAFGAHAAGAHPDYPGAAALYAWLLYVGGQRAVATRVLDTALFDAGEPDPMLRAVRDLVAQTWPVPDASLLVPPVRLAPYSDANLEDGSVVSSATLIDGGRRALAPARNLDDRLTQPGTALWVRNGLGRTVRASVEQRIDPGIPVLVLRLANELPEPTELVAEARPPFAGSIGYSTIYSPQAESTMPAWPLLQDGFFGRQTSQDTLPDLGIEIPAGPPGGPVFDAAGRLAGIAIGSDDGRDRLVPVSTLEPLLGQVFGKSSASGPTPRMALDLLYERSLLLTLQVIVERPPG
jgi:hypothetical protein